jgi:hypothetical protein
MCWNWNPNPVYTKVYFFFLVYIVQVIFLPQLYEGSLNEVCLQIWRQTCKLACVNSQALIIFTFWMFLYFRVVYPTGSMILFFNLIKSLPLTTFVQQIFVEQNMAPFAHHPHWKDSQLRKISSYLSHIDSTRKRFWPVDFFLYTVLFFKIEGEILKICKRNF